MKARNSASPAPRRRWIWTGAIALALFALYLCFGLWGVPAIARAVIPDKASEALGRQVTLEDAAFNPLTLEMRLMGLEIAGRGGDGLPLLRIEDCAANVQIASVLPNRIELKRVFADGVSLNLAIEDNGSLSIRDIVDRLAAAPKEEEPEEPETPKARVRNLDISNVAIAFADRSLGAPYEERLEIERLVGSDIGTFASEERAMDPGRPDSATLVWHFRMRAALGSGGAIEARGGALAVEPWRFAFRATLDGFDLASLQPFVREKVAASIEGLFAGRAEGEVTLAESGPEARVEAELTLSDLAVFDEARRYVDIPRIAVAGISAQPLELRGSVASVEIEAPVARVARLPDGSIGLPQLVEGPDLPPEPVSSASDAALDFSLAKLTLHGGAVELSDASLDSPYEARVENVAFELSDLAYSTAGDAPVASGRGRFSAELLSGSVGAEFQLASLEEGVAVDARWDSLQLAPLQPYLEPFARAVLRGGAVSGSATATALDAQRYQAEAQLELVDLQVAAQGADEPAIALRSLGVENARAAPEGISVETIALNEPRIRARITDSGIDLLEMLPSEEVSAEPEAAGAPAPASAEESAALPKVAVSAFQIRDGRIEVSNTTLVSQQRTVIEKLAIDVTDVSTEPGSTARFDVSALLDGSARVAASGRIEPLDPKRDLELKLEVDGHDLTATSAYWETYVGRELAEGQFDIASGYTVAAGKLEGANRIVVQDLTLGERVESEQAIGLPVGFAIKLLQDANRTITIENLPVTGDLNDPKVSPNPMELAMKALGNLIAKAATSPFSFLAGLAGGREDLDTVAFALGEVDLSQDAREKAQSLANVLEQRPLLRLKISAASDEAGERAALRDRALDYALARDGQAPARALDVAGPFDAAAFEERVRAAYSETRDVAVDEAAAESPDLGEASQSKRVGVFAKVRRWLRLGGDEEPTGAEPAAEERPSSQDSAPSQEAPRSPSLEEMRSALLAERPELAVPDAWLKELASERIQRLKTAIVEAGDLDPARIVVGEPAPSTGGKGSSLKLALSE